MREASGPIEPLYDLARLNNKLGNPTGPVRALLDAETALCQLLCNNCHHVKTHGYPRLPKCAPCATPTPSGAPPVSAAALAAYEADRVARAAARAAAFKAAWDSDDDEW